MTFNIEEVIFKYQVQMLYMKIDPDSEAIFMTGPGGQISKMHWSLRVSAKVVPKYPHRKVGDAWTNQATRIFRVKYYKHQLIVPPRNCPTTKSNKTMPRISCEGYNEDNAKF